jgi:hypothetical protein
LHIAVHAAPTVTSSNHAVSWEKVCRATSIFKIHFIASANHTIHHLCGTKEAIREWSDGTLFH